MFDSSTAIHYPHDMDISYEPSNNYTVQSRPERVAVSGRQKTILRSGTPSSLANRWQPPFLVTICPTESTAAGLTGHLGRRKISIKGQTRFISLLYMSICYFEETRASFRIIFL